MILIFDGDDCKSQTVVLANSDLSVRRMTRELRSFSRTCLSSKPGTAAKQVSVQYDGLGSSPDSKREICVQRAAMASTVQE